MLYPIELRLQRVHRSRASISIGGGCVKFARAFLAGRFLRFGVNIQGDFHAAQVVAGLGIVARQAAGAGGRRVVGDAIAGGGEAVGGCNDCLLYTSDAADE